MKQVAMIEQRLAEVTTEVRRNGKVFVPGEDNLVPVDQAAHSELLAVQGVTPTLWNDLLPAPGGANLPAVIAPAKTRT